MSEGAFRRLDVDQYDEDRVLPAQLYTPDPRGPTQVLEVTRRKTSECRALLQRGDAGEALKLVLEEAPYGEGVDEAKLLSLNAVVSILNSTKSSDIAPLIGVLTPVQQVTLMKYLYKAMEDLSETSGNVVLGWHERLTELAGVACIVRVMTDRRRV